MTDFLPQNQQEIIKNQFNKESFIKDTIDQINKDLDFAGIIQIKNILEKTYDKLVDELYPMIDHLSQKNPQLMFQLLYRVDISENKIKKTLEQNSNVDYIMLLTEMIIYREAQKVYLRSLFK